MGVESRQGTEEEEEEHVATGAVERRASVLVIFKPFLWLTLKFEMPRPSHFFMPLSCFDRVMLVGVIELVIGKSNVKAEHMLLAF